MDFDEYFLPKALTGKAIADAVGIGETHITRSLKPLIAHGIVKRKKAHILGVSGKKQYCYCLSSSGISMAKDLMEYHNLDQNSLKRMFFHVGYPMNVEETHLVDREEEINNIMAWLHGNESNYAAVVGVKGIGKSILLHNIYNKVKTLHNAELIDTEGQLWPRTISLIRSRGDSHGLLIVDGIIASQHDLNKILSDIVGLRFSKRKVILGIRISRSEDAIDLPFPEVFFMILTGLNSEAIGEILGIKDQKVAEIICSITEGNPLAAWLIYDPQPKVPEDMTLEEYYLMRYIKIKGAGIV